MSYSPSLKRPRIIGYKNHTLIQGGVEDLYNEIKSFMAGQATDCPAVDVFFAFSKDGKRVPAHKLILACGSEVLKSKFFRKEHSQYFCEEIGDVPGYDDVTGDAFLEFLQFFYLNEIKLTMEHIVDVVKLVDYYQVGKCMDICWKFLQDNIMDNGMIGLDLALLYGQNEVKKFYENHFIVNIQRVLEDGNFLQCSERVLEHILKMEFLSCSEAELFEACMSWVAVKSGQVPVTKELVERHIKCFFREIRFKSMTSEECSTLTDSYESVLSTDFRVITKMIAIPDFHSNDFNNHPRMPAMNENSVIKFNRVSSQPPMEPGDWTGSSEEERTIFSTDKPLLLGGLVCEKLMYVYDWNEAELPRGLSVDVTITELERVGSSSGTLLLAMTVCLGSARNEIKFPKLVLIRPDYWYEIRIPQFPVGYCYANAILKDDVEESDVTIRFEDLSSSPCTKHHAFIRELHCKKI